MKKLVLLAGCATLSITSSCNKDGVIVADDPADKTACSHVYEYLPAPGQFINEQVVLRTMDEACAWAEKQLAAPDAGVSLGGFGGYIVVGFDRPIICTGGYDFAVEGNAFATSSEPGIVWVMEDTNGNGAPDDTWYELRGSEYGKPETLQEYAVTYYRPAEKGAGVAWTDNLGRSGTLERLNFHTQDSYYPAWVGADSYTLRGTRLEARNYSDGTKWIAPPYEWGYADNFSTADRPAESHANMFRIADAVQSDGEPAGLASIDFVKIQTGVHAQSGELGEISTEVFAVRNLNR